MIAGRRLVCMGAATLVAGGVLSFQGVATKVGAAPNPITFGVPSIVDPIHTVGEPDIAIDRAGNTFVSGPAGSGEQRSLWWSSVDGGQTYRVIEPITSANALASEPNNPGGGDTDIAFDNQTPQNQYFSDLFALTALRVAKTSNEGASVTQTLVPGVISTTSEVDRQWYAVWDPGVGGVTSSPNTNVPTIYIEYGPSPSKWLRSTDGQTFVRASTTSHTGADGYPSIDQSTGKVFEATYSGSNIVLNIGTPFDTSGDLCFRDDTVATCPAADGAGSGVITVAPAINSSGEAANFVVSSMDGSRNLYVAWVSRTALPGVRQVWVSAAPANNATAVNGCTVNCWNSWTAPVAVSDGLPTTGDQVNIFPWIKAGGSGMADAVWYGDQSNLDPSATCTPGSTGCHVWNVFMNQLKFPVDTSGVITGAAPTTNLVKVTPHAMDYYDVCLQGTGCVAVQGNRNLADFFEVNIDHTGAAEIVYDDMSNGLIQVGSSNPADHAGAPVVSVIRQNGGPGLLGTTVAGPSAAPTNSMNDAAGDALFPVVGGSNLPAMDITNSTLSLSGSTLTVTMKVADLTQLAAVAQATAGTMQAFVTRWQMGNTLYYAMATITAGQLATAQFSGGAVHSVDLCSVSACLPRVLTYSEDGAGVDGTNTETGTATCPTAPSATNPCVITITVNGADIGNPTASNLLESVGAYAFTESHPQAGTTNVQAAADNVPLEIDGVCCYNFAGNAITGVPETPLTVGLIGVGGAMLVAGIARRRVAVRRLKNSNTTE